MKKNFLAISIVILGTMIAFGIVQGFGFEKNSEHRKGADTESVAGCMESCEDMLAGWLEMNPDSPNYTRQAEKIAAKAEQCLGMNALVDHSPITEGEILVSCGLGATCRGIPTDMDISEGACADISKIFVPGEEGFLVPLSLCCTQDPSRAIDYCGADAEWVVGVTAFPVCYIPGS